MVQNVILTICRERSTKIRDNKETLMSKAIARRLVEDLGGTVTELSGPLPDGSGFMVGSFPLPKGHWLTAGSDGFNVPPMPMRMGWDRPERKRMESALREAGKYACRAATNNGKIIGFDPDALIQNLIVGMLGYWTIDGLSSDAFANPENPPPELS
jgi:hypothetical protein